MDWRKVVEPQLEEAGNMSQQLMLLQSETRQVQDQVMVLRQEQVPFLDQKVSLISSTVQALADDMQSVHTEHEQEVARLKSYIDASGST